MNAKLLRVNFMLVMAMFLAGNFEAKSQCTWHTFIYDGFEYATTVPGLQGGTTTHNTPQAYAVRTGAKSVYMNFVTGLTPGTLVYNRQIITCPGVPINISAWLTTSFGGVQCDVKLQVVDANNNVLASLDTLKPAYAPNWSQFLTGPITPTTTMVYFKLYTNNGGSAGGNDLSMDDFLVEQCHNLNLGSDTTICNTDTVTLDAGAGFNTYLWGNNSNGRYLAASTTATGNAQYQYTVTVWDANGCQFKDTIIVDFTICTAVNDIDAIREFSVSPNPAHDYINITSNQTISKVTIYNSIGKIAKEFTGKTTVFTGDLSTGVYIIKAETANGKKMYRKIIVE